MPGNHPEAPSPRGASEVRGPKTGARSARAAHGSGGTSKSTGKRKPRGKAGRNAK
jgi:hypothetical protein